VVLSQTYEDVPIKKGVGVGIAATYIEKSYG
jgi:hypothetical protein